MLKKTISKTALILALTTCSAYAGTQIGATRVIYSEGKKETSVSITNKDASPYLIKSWIENYDISGTHFMVTPPLFRMDGQQKNVIRIFKANNPLPTDRESLFFLNITSIPASNGDDDRNTLQIAVRTKIKLIYRPKALMDNIPESFSEKLIWTVNGNSITGKNTSPYYINLAQITLNGKVIPMAEKNYLPPMSSTTYELPANNSKSGVLEWSVINDHGGKGKIHKATL
ncbi:MULTISPECIES: fimbrial biogenesis chaperone [Leclercia]|uniref:fimbrial biogenesis chaperone n=1 Tax=Leclercia TaxID=83654 RepID=UPI00254E2440|nr:fimbria/pilus periplasmic chaperone [Leclercia adecarboxylata]